MSRLSRILLGLIVVSLLVPAVAMTSPGFWSGVSLREDAADIDPEAAADLRALNQPLAASGSNGDGDEVVTDTGCNGEGCEEATDHSEHADHGSTTTGAADGGTGDTSSDSSPSKGPGITSSGSPTTAAPSAGGPSGGTITGTACPCTVTGTATLQGSISLSGDLIVDGGTLVARPGVDLNGNGFQIMFMNGGKADFQGTKTSTWSGDGGGANVNRDVEFRNMRRIMFHQGAGKSILKYFSVSNSGTLALGDYPLHWHLNGGTTSGTIVEGVAVVGGKRHAFVPHGSHGITFKDTIALNTTDTAYWWDGPGTTNCSGAKNSCTTDNSNNTVFDHALAYGVKPRPGDDGHRVAGFRLGAGSGNVVRNSAATNISGGKDCAGYHWPEDANQNRGGNVWVFSNNRSSSPDCHGIFVWQNDSGSHVISGFVGQGVDQGAYSNRYQYRSIDVPYVEVHALGWSVVNSTVDHVLVSGHNQSAAGGVVTFDNVAIGSFTINNGDGDTPGTYILKNTGLTCDDIDYNSVMSGTKVVVDGVNCT